MNRCSTLLQECSEFVHLQLDTIASQLDFDVLEAALSKSQINDALLKLDWEPLTRSTFADTNKDLLVDLTWKKCILDLLSSDSDDSVIHGPARLMANLKKCSIILDSCFHSRGMRTNRTDWSNTFFDLFLLVTNLLSWPDEILSFWGYAETRLNWFKLNKFCEDGDLVKFDANSNLISYRVPFSDKLRHWNEFLKIVEYNSSLNTPIHYKMKYKLEKFLTELLPTNEESNYNRSATIVKKQQSGNPWNNIEMKTRPSTPEEIFHDDYNYIVNKLIRSPVEFAFNTLSFKIDFDRVCTVILDAIFADEDRYYKEIKSIKKKALTQDTSINGTIAYDLDMPDNGVANYMRKSKVFEQKKNEVWNDFIKLNRNSELLVRSTVLDISTLNPDSLYSQMTTIENDHFRKQFVLQLVFTIKFINSLVTNDNVRSFYKNCYMKDDMLKNINFDDMDDKNKQKTINFTNYVLETRIKTFYSTRDSCFHDLIGELISSDVEFLNAKMDNFKNFQNIIVPAGSVEDDAQVDYSFKKFGFIKFGNKQISNAWKIPTGLQSIKQYKIDPSEVYNELKDTLQNTEDKMDIDTEKKDEIVKQWQTLRSLRSQYVFEFNKFGETVGLEGLFNDSPVQKNGSEFQDLMRETLLKSHRTKLLEAREYAENHSTLKRKLPTSELNKKITETTPKVEDKNEVASENDTTTDSKPKSDEQAS